MKTLWVTGQRADGRGGGGSAHEHLLLTGLAERHEIRVLTSDARCGPIGDVTLEIASGWKPRRGPRRATERAWLELTARAPLDPWLLRDRLDALAAALARQIEDWAPDLVHVMQGELAPLAARVDTPSAVLLLDSYSRQASAEWGLGRQAGRRRLRTALAQRAGLRRARRFERRWYRQPAGLACVSEEDAAAVRSLTGRDDVAVIPNPIPPELFAEPTVSRDPATVAFVGSLEYGPNVDALRWLTRDIWPLVRAVRPDARLVAAGRRPVDATITAELDAAGLDGLHLDVEDIRPVYWRAGVVIAPVRLGSGVRNKVLHALAAGAPVVATPTALEGTGLGPEEHLLVGTSPDELAAAVVACLDDPEAAAGRTAAARCILDRFTQHAALAAMDRWWSQIS